ncbi:MAG: hypothetical protein AUK60_10665 [Rhodobacteraceae bacterium CG2_30_10_405]|nr:hypothetical protein [Rhodobacterales bacterium]NCO17377.1 hypothetical protein [Alphaproteobacteria bacterium]OIQ05222.1 MAG: hypothetical protein AUK60_10665 [Rhodobacteraceae bacterium CG2_30_10_405]
MGHQAAFHAPNGGAGFLALRYNRSGATEIVYDDGATRRMIWRVETPDLNEDRIADALSVAVGALRVVPALYLELKKRAIAIEQVTG